MRERNTPGLVRVGAVEIVGSSAMGVTETDTTSTAKTGAENMAEMGAAGEVAVGISVSVATRSSSKAFVVKEIDMQDKGRPQQRDDTIIYV